MKSILVITILGLVAFVGVESCHPPRTMSGEYNLFIYNVAEDNLRGTISGTAYIDQEHKRARFDITYGGTEKYKIIKLFKERIQYDITDEHCEYKPVQEKILGLIDLAANASIVSRGRIGTSANGLNIVRYAGVTSKVKYIKTFTQKDCVPTSGIAVFSLDGVKVIAYSSYTRSRVSLNFDDAVFKIPPECREAHGARARRSVEEILGNVKHIFEA